LSHVPIEEYTALDFGNTIISSNGLLSAQAGRDCTHEAPYAVSGERISDVDPSPLTGEFSEFDSKRLSANYGTEYTKEERGSEINKASRWSDQD
jgi:hypothetical protein